LADIIHLPGKRIHVIYNPVITADFRRKSRQAVDHEWFQKQSVPVIVGVGSLCPQKDFQTLIEAFYELRKRRPVRLLIMGEGEDRTALENQIVRLGLTKDVQLPGFVDNPYPYMARASVFVLSSRWEGLPGALIEALYLGVPLVATDCKSGPEEVLENGKLGKLVSVGEPTELALAIENCLDRPHPPRSADSWQRFSPQTIVSQYLNLLLQESA
jgi:glycosyltransferase involved in cell wall biosynthesis